MRKVLTAGLALALVAATPALARAQGRQPPSQDELQANKEKKLAEEFLKKADWTTDYDEALAKAKESGKLIFAYFTRSYAY